MGEYPRADAARRAGVSVEDLGRMVELGILRPGDDDRFSAGDIRKAGLLATLQSGGLPLEAIADRIHSGWLSLDWLDSPSFALFSALSPVTFEELSLRSGAPVELLMVLREATGSAVPAPSDPVREIELAIVPFVDAHIQTGYAHETIGRLLRTMGESLRRYVLAEADAFRATVIEPVAHLPGGEIGAAAAAANVRLQGPVEDALLGLLRAQQAHAWSTNILEGFERSLVEAGLMPSAERQPAICFLDITGYTRLTDEHGDEAAADLAERLARLVQRTSVRHGGRAVKWLGDGVMLWFRDPGPGVVAALEMVEGVTAAGLPPAHVGLHAGAVLFQDGDYFGQTVNIASRIADYARPGEVLVSQAVIDASAGAPVAYAEVGPVELKGVGGTVHLHVARKGS